jgi:type 1 glutamine amidotransferase
MRFLTLLFTLLVSAPALTLAADNTAAAPASGEPFNVLVFSKTNGFRHKDAIAAGIPFFKKMGELHNFKVDASEDAALFTTETLKKYQVIVLLNTTGDFIEEKLDKKAPPEQREANNVVTAARREAFENFVKNGGAIVGLHSATDYDKKWPEFGKIIGAHFLHHPAHQTAELVKVDADSPIVAHLPERWKCFDEWYSFNYLQEDNHVLQNLDEKTYKGGKNGANHPFTWTRVYGKGKIFYTSRGHYGTAFAEPDYAQLVLNGLFWTLDKPFPKVDAETLPKVKGDKKKK